MLRFRTAALAALLVPLVLLSACSGGSSGGMLPTTQPNAGAIHPLTSSTSPLATGQLPLSTTCPGIPLPSGAGHSGIHMPPMQHFGGRLAVLNGATAMPARPGCSSGFSGRTPDTYCGGVVPNSTSRGPQDAGGCCPPGDVQYGPHGNPLPCGSFGGGSGGGGSGGGIPPGGGPPSPCWPSCIPSPGPHRPVVSDSHKIANEAKYMYDIKSVTSKGPTGGKNACAWKVNKILKSSTGRTFGRRPDLVSSVEKALKADGYQVPHTSTGMTGDIAVQGADNHIGICANAGCTLAYSNSSGSVPPCFCNLTGPRFAGPGWPHDSPTLPARFYRIP